MSERGVHVREREEEMASTQPRCGTEKSSVHGRASGGDRGQTRMVPSTVAIGAPSGDKLVRIVTLTTYDDCMGAILQSTRTGTCS